jgi:hypothetical protein
MHDWETMVRQQLESCAMPSAYRDEIASELAAHLEETYEAALSQGLTEAAALELTLQELESWDALATDIRYAKSEEESMNNRTKGFWLPAMVNLLAAMTLLMLMQRAGMQPRLIWVNAADGKFALVFYFPWLMALPLLGAAGAYLAQRAQAENMACLAAGSHPH